MGVIIRNNLVLLLICVLLSGCKINIEEKDNKNNLKSYEEEITQARRLANTVYESEIEDAIEALANRVFLLEKKDESTCKQRWE